MKGGYCFLEPHPIPLPSEAWRYIGRAGHSRFRLSTERSPPRKNESEWPRFQGRVCSRNSRVQGSFRAFGMEAFRLQNFMFFQVKGAARREWSPVQLSRRDGKVLCGSAPAQLCTSSINRGCRFLLLSFVSERKSRGKELFFSCPNCPTP